MISEDIERINKLLEDLKKRRIELNKQEEQAISDMYGTVKERTVKLIGSRGKVSLDLLGNAVEKLKKPDRTGVVTLNGFNNFPMGVEIEVDEKLRGKAEEILKERGVGTLIKELTSREKEILGLAAFEDKEIGYIRGIAKNTLGGYFNGYYNRGGVYRTGIFGKLGVHDRTTAVLAGIWKNQIDRIILPIREEPSGEALTPREFETLGHVAEGLHYKQIAEVMYIKWRTVRNHREEIFRKLGICTRTGLAIVFLVGKEELKARMEEAKRLPTCSMGLPPKLSDSCS